MAEDAAEALYGALVRQDPAAAIEVIESVKASGVTQEQLFDDVYVPAMALLGGAWARGDVDELTFTQAAVTSEQIGSFVIPPATARDTGIVVIIGCMEDDLHSVARDIIGAALKDAGHRVIDLGVDIRPADFLERVEETGARIVIVCAERTQSARGVKRVREMLVAGGHDVALLVAGGPFAADESLARAAGANGVVMGAERALRIIAKIARDRLGAGGS